MSGMSENLEERVAELEDRLGVFEGLRAMTDADLSSVAAQAKATNIVVKALAEDMRDVKKDLRETKRDVREIKAGQEAIVGLLNELIRRDDEQRGEQPPAE